MATTKSEGTARERLLKAANELFYEEGVHTVGIDRVIERAGVAKASLYGTFGSKEELVLAYLQLRQDTRQRRINERLALYWSRARASARSSSSCVRLSLSRNSAVVRSSTRARRAQPPK